jgi:hypothetical protein
MAIAVSTWEALEAKIVADWANGVHVASYTMAGQTFSYSNLDQQRRLLSFVQGKINALTPGSESGKWQLYRAAAI